MESSNPSILRNSYPCGKHVKLISFLYLAVLLISLFGSCKRGLKTDPHNGGITLPDGFSALVVADSVGRARHIAVNSNGDIYVALQELHNGKGIVALRDEDGDGRADIIKYFGSLPGTGLAIHNGFLYFAPDTALLRYRLIEGELLPDTIPELIVGGFTLEYEHAAKSIAMDDSGFVYINVGAPSNACQVSDRQPGVKGMDPCPILARHGGIWRFKADLPGQTQEKNGVHYATGIRNAVAIDWNPFSKYLYAMQHGRDQLSQFWPDLYTEQQGADLPAEEFLLVKKGSDFGWPYCYYDLQKNKKVLAPEYGGNGDIVGRCAQKLDPIMAFPAHTAPNDLLFYRGTQFPEKYQKGAFIAFHGSWNRAPLEQLGYYVAFVPFKGEFPSGGWEIFADGFKGKNKVMSPDEAVARPMGLAEGPDGSLYITDSEKGKIWRVLYHSK